MTALLALSLCGVCVVAAVGLYYSMPPVGARPNVYEFALWMLLGTALEGSATTLMVSLASPLPIHPAWWLP
jgi:hypothetical protein